MTVQYEPNKLSQVPFTGTKCAAMTVLGKQCARYPTVHFGQQAYGWCARHALYVTNPDFDTIDRILDQAQREEEKQLLRFAEQCQVFFRLNLYTKLGESLPEAQKQAMRDLLDMVKGYRGQ